MGRDRETDRDTDTNDAAPGERQKGGDTDAARDGQKYGHYERHIQTSRQMQRETQGQIGSGVDFVPSLQLPK